MKNSEKREIKGVLFDMDGVLVDSEPAITRAAIEVLASDYGIAAKKEDFLEFTGMGENRFIGGVVEKHGGVYTTDMKERAYERYGEIAGECVTVYGGVKEMLKTLSESGYKMCICSSADLVKVRINMNICGASKYISDVISGSEMKRTKPFPDIYLSGADRIGLPPENCVVVEDAVSGVKAGKAAGCRVVAVTTSFPKEELLAAGADAVTDRISALPEIIKTLQ
ncbi:MAG: HAD family phosphatase [Clostridia bacterium]|nr:HAD family phosphatase [Clostridia bacterium]